LQAIFVWYYDVMKLIIRSILISFLSLLFLVSSTGFFIASHQCDNKHILYYSISFASDGSINHYKKCSCTTELNKTPLCPYCKVEKSKFSKPCCHTKEYFFKISEKYMPSAMVYIHPIVSAIALSPIHLFINIFAIEQGYSYLKPIIKPPKPLWGKLMLHTFCLLKISLC
jgi:hypothetical protein